MSKTVVRATNGRKLTVYGQAEYSSSTTAGHADAMNNLVERLAASGQYEYVTLQRSLRTATGRVAPSRSIPDVIAVRRDGAVDLWEVRSNSQTAEELGIKLERDMQSLPVQRRGRPRVIEPEPNEGQG